MDRVSQNEGAESTLAFLVALAEMHDFDGHQIATQASMGIATSAIEYTSAEDVLRDADTAIGSLPMPVTPLAHLVLDVIHPPRARQA